MDCRRQTTSPVLTKHDVVDWVSVHFLLVDVGGEQLDVAAAAVDALLVLHGELDDEGLVLVVEVTEAGRQGVEAGILACLQTCKKSRRDYQVIKWGHLENIIPSVFEERLAGGGWKWCKDVLLSSYYVVRTGKCVGITLTTELKQHIAILKPQNTGSHTGHSAWTLTFVFLRVSIELPGGQD